MSDLQRRKQQRRSVRGQASLQFPGSSIEVRLLDISSHGIGMVAPLPLPIGVRCGLHFALPRDAERTSLDVEATAVSCVLSAADGGFRLGMQFVLPLPSIARTEIERYIG